MCVWFFLGGRAARAYCAYGCVMHGGKQRRPHDMTHLTPGEGGIVTPAHVTHAGIIRSRGEGSRAALPPPRT